jgi:hypothetical protein
MESSFQDIKMGQYVMTYLGEVIDHDEAEKRGKARRPRAGRT